MGPRARARGNEVVPVLGPGNCLASMGPRARARGNVSFVSKDGTTWAASMGPRARARGNTQAARVRLQGLSLQWGRERALAETRTGRASSRCLGGFNGAASARSRKLIQWHPYFVASTQLQ